MPLRLKLNASVSLRGSFNGSHSLFKLGRKTIMCMLDEGARNEISTFLTNHFPDLTRILIITDETVAELHLESIIASIRGLESNCFYCT